MRKAQATSSANQTADHHQTASGSPLAKWTMAATTPAAAGMGIPTKYFLPGRPGFEGCGFTWNIEAGQAAGAGDHEHEGGDGAQLHQARAQLAVGQDGQQAESPHPGEHGGGHAEGDDVGQRVQLAAEVAGGAGHARDAPVEHVEDDGEADGAGGKVEVPGLRHRALHGLGDRKVAEGHVGGGEQRRQQVHAAAQALAALGRGGVPAGPARSITASLPSSSTAVRGSVTRSRRANTLEPPCTLSPTLHLQSGGAVQDHVHARAELDQADALARAPWIRPPSSRRRCGAPAVPRSA